MSIHVLTFALQVFTCHIMSMPRERKPSTYTLSPAVLALLDEWIAAQEFPPNKSAVVEMALLEFIERRKRETKGR